MILMNGNLLTYGGAKKVRIVWMCLFWVFAVEHTLLVDVSDACELENS